MKPLLLISFAILICFSTYGQDTAIKHTSDSISRVIDLSGKFLAYEEFDTIACYDCPIIYIACGTKYFTNSTTKQVEKIIEQRRYFINYSLQLTDSIVTDYYYFNKETLFKLVSTKPALSKGPQMKTFYFSQGEIDEWKRKGKQGPSINERESLLWKAEYLVGRCKK